MSTHTCEQTSDELVAFLDGELGDEERRPVADHLATCLTCRRELEGLTTVQGLVGAGIGLAVSPRLTVDEDDPSVSVIDLHDRIPARLIGLVWHSDRHRSAAAEAFVDSAIAVCRELTAEPAAA